MAQQWSVLKGEQSVNTTWTNQVLILHVQVDMTTKRQDCSLCQFSIGFTIII